MIAIRLIIIVALALVKLFNPFAAEAQQADKIARIGYLSLNVGAGDAGYGFREAFRQGLRDFGYVESRNSLARPGGNVTGLSVFAPDLVGKSLELLTQTVPRVNRVALLLNPDALTDRAIKDRLRIADGAARVLGLRLQALEARGPQDSTAPSRK